jgi:hypothetical protein
MTCDKYNYVVKKRIRYAVCKGIGHDKNHHADGNCAAKEDVSPFLAYEITEAYACN